MYKLIKKGNIMPENTKVARCVNKLKAKGDDKYNPYAVCQASTGQSYKTGKKLKKKGKSKMESQLESLKEFITKMKTPKNEAFIENVVMKGFNVCFEGEEITVDEEKVITLPDTPEETDEVKRKLDEVEAATRVTDMKKEELREITKEDNI